MRIVWSQGMAPKDKPHLGTWQIILRHRLTGDFGAIPPTRNTVIAEDALGLGRCTYWYVLRVDAAFGQIMVAWDVDPTAAPTSGRICRFDTGGIWRQKIQTAPPLSDDAARVTFFREHDQSLSAGLGVFPDWVNEHFETPCEYVEGRAPERLACAIVCDPAHNQPRAWTWEARANVADDTAKRMAPSRVFWPDAEYDEFLRWLERDDTHLNVADAVSLMALCVAISSRSDTPFREAVNYLCSAASDGGGA